MKCQNCNADVEGAYCSQCGQDASTHRFEFRHMITESLDAVLNLRRGLPYTVKQMFTRPGNGVRDYVLGHRARWYKPLAYIALMGFISGIGLQIYGGDLATVNGGDIGGNVQQLIQDKMNGLFARNYSIFQAILLPLTACWSYLFFVKNRFNYAENLVMNCYVMGTTGLVSTLLLVLLHFLGDSPWRVRLSIFVYVGIFAYQIACYVRFFKSPSMASSIVRAILANLVSTLCVGILLMIAMMIYLFNGGIETIIEDSPYEVSIKHIPDFEAEGFDQHAISIALPADYYHYPKKNYPVVYMQDGEKLFETDSTNNAYQEWGVDEAMHGRFVQRKPGAIVVGVHNTANRWSEYAPQKALQSYFDTLRYAETDHQNHRDLPLSGDAYLAYIVEHVKPYVDSMFRTRPEREHTAICGSSMGGLVSWNAVIEYPDVFGAAGCMSPHWPGLLDDTTAAATAFILDHLDAKLPAPGVHRFWFDHGTVGQDARYAAAQAVVDSLFTARGYSAADWQSRVYTGAGHSEDAWNKRFPEVLDFLLEQTSDTLWLEEPRLFVE